jgi:hypothetical protein
MKVPSWVKPGIWGVIVGALAWWAVLGYGFGWESAATAKERADDQTQTAVVAVATPDCVARFEKQANAVASWRALKKSADNYDQSDFMEKGGWVVLPKQTPDSDYTGAVADACASQLLALKQLNGTKLTTAAN